MISKLFCFFQIKGLTEALKNDRKVCSVYSPEYVKKVFPAIQNTKEGIAIFTFPKVTTVFRY